MLNLIRLALALSGPGDISLTVTVTLINLNQPAFSFLLLPSLIPTDCGDCISFFAFVFAFSYSSNEYNIDNL